VVNVAEKILDIVIGDTVIGSSMVKRVALPAGSKIEGELKIVYITDASLAGCRLIISKLNHAEDSWERVYESPNIAEIPDKHWSMSFEASEDGEYEIYLYITCVYVQVQLYLEKAHKDVTVPYGGS